MRLLIQRVSSASLTIDGKASWSIESWLVCYIGISNTYDTNNTQTISKAVNQLLNIDLRENRAWRLKRNILESEGSIMVVSNFTLWGQIKKWTQLDFGKAAKFENAKIIYDQFVHELQESYNDDHIITWKFGAIMNVESVNDWPINIIIDL